MHLERVGNFSFIELGQKLHEMNFNDGIFTAHAGNQVRNHLRFERFLNDLEYGRFLFRLALIRMPQQVVNTEVLLVNPQDLDQCGF